jgi:leader peptidase (prepilin peptidase) / N-methyltransferase
MQSVNSIEGNVLLQVHGVWWLVLAGGVLGLIVGSFLNVVIYRLPKMIMEEGTKLNLALPRSHCPRCQKTLSWWHNVPLLSYILLKRRCAFCGESIHWRYPLVEVISALLSAFIVWRFGVSWPCGFVLLITWCLLAAFVIDCEHQLLPDVLTLGVLWLGLLANAFSVFVPPTAAIVGAIAGFLAFWLVSYGYECVRKRAGLGGGDVKLLAAFGACLGGLGLPMLVLVSSAMAVIITLILMAFKRHHAEQYFAFGPYLILTGWVMLVFFV